MKKMKNYKHLCLFIVAYFLSLTHLKIDIRKFIHNSNQHKNQFRSLESVNGNQQKKTFINKTKLSEDHQMNSARIERRKSINFRSYGVFSIHIWAPFAGALQQQQNRISFNEHGFIFFQMINYP